MRCLDKVRDFFNCEAGHVLERRCSIPDERNRYCLKSMPVAFAASEKEISSVTLPKALAGRA
jgi:peptide methionine sulfoxide reductase MsrB